MRPFVYAQLLLCVLLVVACVTPYEPDTVSISPSLIVEGMITDQPGPYTVKLTRTADFSYKSLNLLETGATVTISDNLGNQETLTEQSPGGNYQSSPTGIRGVAGRTYKVTIKTKGGATYQSDPELLKAAPPIDRIYYEYKYVPGAINNRKANTWNVYIDMKDPTTTGDYYRWEWAHYEFVEVCQKVSSVGQSLPMGIPCCSNCWDITRCYSNCINILSDANVNGNSISRQFIQEVLYEASTRYYVEITQQSLSKGIYEFFKTAKQQVQNTGGLFDAAPGSIGGNIHATSDPSLKVYGYFGAAGESIGYLLLDRSEAVGPPVSSADPVIVNPMAPCAVCANNQYRTPNKPRWWQF